jgi:hypothetical protein
VARRGEFEQVVDGILECVRELEQYVPGVGGWILRMLFDIPQASELDLYDLAEAYRDASALFENHLADANRFVDDLTLWGGDGAAVVAAGELRAYLEETQQAADNFSVMAEMVEQSAVGIETMKYMAAADIIMLLVTLVVAVATSIITGGASLAAAAGEAAVTEGLISEAATTLTEKLLEQGVKAAAKAAVKKLAGKAAERAAEEGSQARWSGMGESGAAAWCGVRGVHRR